MIRNILLFFAILTFHCSATEIPVFRYALERWIPEAYTLILTHSGDLTEEQQKLLAELNEKVDDFRNDAYWGGANMYVQEINLSTDLEGMSEKSRNEIKDILGGAFPEIPSFALLSPYPRANVWSGEFTRGNLKYLITSPARQAVIHHVMRGVTGVWLMIDGSDPAVNDKVEADIREYSALMSEEMPPPRIGDSYKYGRHYVESEIPLLLEFEVIRVAADNPKEQCLVNILRNPDIAKALEINPEEIGKQPLAIPLFGRGRSFYGIVGDEITQDNVLAFCHYLLGNCSCQVKMQNPGIDFLFSALWLGMLIGEEAAPAMPTQKEMMPDPVIAAKMSDGSASAAQHSTPPMIFVVVGLLALALVALIVRRNNPSYHD
ncbi:MAG: hypothetical protein HQL32_02880 [Planctomycetes bacterium]|nr:hypothetical protein [Planctomycetota bacterium]